MSILPSSLLSALALATSSGLACVAKGMEVREEAVDEDEEEEEGEDD